MKHTLIFLAILVTSFASAQKYFTKTGVTEFKASVETFEVIESNNESSTVILNIETGEIAALLFLKAFHFEIALMQEHFNENYMDSDEFPKATFKGLIEEFSIDKLTDSEKEFNLKGTLTVRGKAEIIDAIAQLKMEKGKIVLSSEFSVSPQDFNIDIPSIVRKKIAESITIKLCYELIEKK